MKPTTSRTTRPKSNTSSKRIFSEATDLSKFANEFFALMFITHVREHDSTNYVDGVYFAGRAAGLSLDVAISDDAAFSDFPFCIYVDRYGPPVKDREYLRGCCDAIARLLAKHGWPAARPATMDDMLSDKPSVQRLVYRRHADSDEITVNEERVSRA